MGNDQIQPGPDYRPGSDLSYTSRPAGAPTLDVRQPDGGLSTLIPYNNPKALIAYYCGVFALIPCVGLVLGPIALTLGILGLQYVKAHPTAKGTGHAIAGIVLGAITTLGNGVVLIGALLSAALAR